MKYLRLDRYIVSLDGIHGILHTIIPAPSLPKGGLDTCQIIITYIGGVSASLDFVNKDISNSCFEKISLALGAE